MAPVLPFSLSPHICILSSPDLSDLLRSSHLPPLPQLLQSFSPLPNVTTRSTSLTSIPHSSFALRFSDLGEIEAACREDEDQRALRMLDWIGARVNRHCVKWVQDVENSPEKHNLMAPWWDDLRRCAEGEHVPSKTEGWNHPVSVILAVSTNAQNPLQAITALHSRSLDFPLWVDATLFRYTLIIHPRNSPLSDEEAGALFNAVKKQYGLHSYLLHLDLPSPPPPPVPVPFLHPRLPPASPQPSTNGIDQTPISASSLNTLRLSEGDIQQTGKFTREFVVMSLVPWMEKCALEWNENFSSTRRLPSRLFSSTRRLFGSPSPSPAPSHNASSSISSLPPKSSYSSSIVANMHPPSQQRRLAEFATILGDYKLATTIWEALRKDGKGGTDILPILLTPTPAIPTYVSNALMSIHPTSPDLPPKAQLRALLHAVRWEAGIPISDFLDDVLGGERWLVWAAGDAEELPSALLLAHAAQLCVRKGFKRKAALWYLIAANKLEKLGIKPLTIHFLRKAHELYLAKPVKLLSPSFWESEYRSSNEANDFILASIEHPLGRLLYTTGDVVNAVKLFIGLLCYSPSPISSKPTADAQQLVPDKLFLEDFRIAFGHLKSTVNNNDKSLIDQLQLPIKICLPRYTRVRLSGDSSQRDDSVWQRREDAWQSFRKNHGDKEGLEKSNKVMVGEIFWIDLVLQNPLDAEITLSNFSVNVREDTETTTLRPVAAVDVIEEVALAAKERKTVSIPIKPLRPATLVMSHITYDFLSLLSSIEQLSYRGQRLHTTAAQKQAPTYGPDVVFQVAVVEADCRLNGSFMEDKGTLLQGEYWDMRIILSNIGSRPITEIWVVADAEDELWLNESQDDHYRGALENEILHSMNSLHPDVAYLIPKISSEESPFRPGDRAEISIKLRAEGSGRKDISLLLTYREGGCKTFHSARLCREYDVQTLFELAATARPCDSMEHMYLLGLEISNNHPSSVIEFAQVTTISPTWNCTAMGQETMTASVLYPSQSSHISIGASSWSGANAVQETLEFVSAAFSDILSGRDVQQRTLPSMNLLCSHVHKKDDSISIQSPVIQHFIQHRRKQIVSRDIDQSFPHVPHRLHSSVFPLYNPFTMDVLVFWTIPSQNRFGHVLLPSLSLGARHAAMREVIESAENTKTNRSMYAETEREKSEVLDSLRNSEWNAEMDPLWITTKGQGCITHNFSNGPRVVPVSLTLRNYSLTHTIKYALKFPMVRKRPSNLVPTYTGQTTFRGTLKPSQSTVVRPKLWITQPGTYAIDEWDLTTEVFRSVETEEMPLRRYNRRPSSEETISIMICGIPRA